MFNEGKPFSIVYPVMVLLAATPLGLAPDGGLGWALLGALAVAVPLSRFSFPLRGRALLWIAFAFSIPMLEPWRAPALLAGALAGWVFFTVFFWGSLYYHLRTGAPWTNFTRFWRLVATNSDPTSGNMLEQVPKMVMALSAATLLAEEPTGTSAGAIAVTVGVACAYGWIAWRRFDRDVLPAYPARFGRATRSPPPAPAACT